MNKTQIKRLVLCAMCVALCCVLPVAFHAVALSKIISPMHIPVLLCGLICGPLYGLFCGIAGPMLSSVITGMPPASALVSMLPELAIYGLAAGLLMKFIHTKHLFADIYASLIPAMILGRVAGGMADALFLLGEGSSYTLSMFAGSYIIGTLPGTIIQLVLIPLLVFTLEKAKAIPMRYPKIVKENA